MLTNNDIQTALRVRRAVRIYFESHSSVNSISAVELYESSAMMKTLFSSEKTMRDHFRLLDDNMQLNLIPQLHKVQMQINRSWNFIRTE